MPFAPEGSAVTDPSRVSGPLMVVVSVEALPRVAFPLTEKLLAAVTVPFKVVELVERPITRAVAFVVPMLTVAVPAPIRAPESRVSVPPAALPVVLRMALPPLIVILPPRTATPGFGVVGWLPTKVKSRLFESVEQVEVL